MSMNGSIVEILILSRDGHSVLVHGSEGTDSTLLISTLAQLIMDPGCRTLEGFLALLEREWVQVSVGALKLKIGNFLRQNADL